MKDYLRGYRFIRSSSVRSIDLPVAAELAAAAASIRLRPMNFVHPYMTINGTNVVTNFGPIMRITPLQQQGTQAVVNRLAPSVGCVVRAKRMFIKFTASASNPAHVFDHLMINTYRLPVARPTDAQLDADPNPALSGSTGSLSAAAFEAALPFTVDVQTSSVPVQVVVTITFDLPDGLISWGGLNDWMFDVVLYRDAGSTPLPLTGMSDLQCTVLEGSVDYYRRYSSSTTPIRWDAVLPGDFEFTLADDVAFPDFDSDATGFPDNLHADLKVAFGMSRSDIGDIFLIIRPTQSRDALSGAAIYRVYQFTPPNFMGRWPQRNTWVTGGDVAPDSSGWDAIPIIGAQSAALVPLPSTLSSNQFGFSSIGLIAFSGETSRSWKSATVAVGGSNYYAMRPGPLRSNPFAPARLLAGNITHITGTFDADTIFIRVLAFVGFVAPLRYADGPSTPSGDAPFTLTPNPYTAINVDEEA